MSCGFVTGPASSDIIEGQLSAVMSYGNSAYQTAMGAIEAIGAEFTRSWADDRESIDVEGAALPDVAGLPDYRPPIAPVATDLVFGSPTPPPAPPSTGDVPDLNLPNMPTFSAADPSYTLPPQPAALSANPPDDPTPLVVPTYPVDPNPIYPMEPALRAITLPTLDSPDLTSIDEWLTQLRGERPEAPNIFLEEDFLGTLATTYDTAETKLATYLDAVPLFASTRAALTAQMAGNSIGIPAVVAQALRERAYGSEDEQEYRAETEALVDWQARGFTLPDGPLLARLDAVRQQARDKKAAINRDLWLEEAKLEIQAFQFAVQQGVAMEGMYRDSWFKLYDLARTIAGQAFDVRIKIIEVYLERYKAMLSGWQTESELVKVSLQAELSKLDAYRSELEAAKLVGELNRQDIEIYRATLEGVKVRVDVYRTSVEAANARLSGEVERIKAYGEMVRAYTARVGAYEAEWRAYGQAVQGEQGKVEIYKSLVAAFGARVDAYGKQVDAEKAAGGFKIDVKKLDLEGWQAKIDRFKAELQAEVARVGAVAQVYDSKVRAFGTEAQAEDNRIESEIRKAGLSLGAYRARTDIAVKESELTLQKLLDSARITQAALESVSRTGAQLAAGAMSALNMSASISNGSSFSNSTSCGESYSYQITQ